MPQLPYRYDFNGPRGPASWLQGPIARRIGLGLGVFGIGLSAWLCYRAQVESTWREDGFLVLNTLVQSIVILASTHPAIQRRLGHYVEVNLREVSWRLPQDGGFWPRRARIPLAQIRGVEIELLRIGFTTYDERRHYLPLGGLPYEIVREVKELLGPGSTFQQVTGGGIARRGDALVA